MIDVGLEGEVDDGEEKKHDGTMDDLKVGVVRDFEFDGAVETVVTDEGMGLDVMMRLRLN